MSTRAKPDVDDIAHWSLDDFVLFCIDCRSNEARPATLRRVWRFLTSDIYRASARLWWQGAVRITWSLKVLPR